MSAPKVAGELQKKGLDGGVEGIRKWSKAYLKSRHALQSEEKVVRSDVAKPPRLSTIATPAEIVRLLKVIERGEDVREFDTDLPPGILAHLWTQLRLLEALFVDGDKPQTVLTRYGLSPIVVKRLQERFPTGGLAALHIDVSLWRWFSLADLKDIDAELHKELAKRQPDPDAVTKLPRPARAW